MELSRKHAQEQAQLAGKLSASVVTDDMRVKEDALKAIANRITATVTRMRVKSDMQLGISRRARVGQEPLSKTCRNCEACNKSKKGSKTFHSLCQSDDRCNFKTRIEQEVYTAFVDAVSFEEDVIISIAIGKVILA